MLDIDSDPRRARTPAAAFYTDPEARAALTARVLRPSWTVLTEPDPQAPENVVPCDVAGAPALWVREPHGPERLLSNVCTHRATTLVDAPCRASRVRCPYHGRRFRLDGSVQDAPGFDGALGPDDDLAAFALGAAGSLRFGALAPPCPFEAWWGPVAARLAHVRFDWGALRLDPAGDRAHALPVPWLLYLENYLEGFHVPFVHPELAKTLALEEYAHELLPWGTLQVGVAKGDGPAFAPTTGPEAGSRIGAYWFWLWPATLVNVYPWGVSLNRIEERGLDRTVIRYRAWVLDPALRGGGAGGDLDRVELQDQAVVLRAWDGLRSGLFRRGRYAVPHELGLHHLHRLLAGALR